MKILLCLLSDQHVPNLLSVHHFHPDRLVLIESETMRQKKAAQHFLTALKLGELDFQAAERHHVQPLEAEDDLDVIRKCLQQAYGCHPADEWIVNLTGGTKPMSIAAYEFFKAVGARLVYVNFARPDVLLGLDGRRQESCLHRPTVREFLAGYGFESRKSEKDIEGDEGRARGWWDAARAIALHCPQQPLLRLGDLSDPVIKKRWDDARKKGLEIGTGQLNPQEEDLRGALASHFNLAISADGLRGKLDKYAIEFLTGGWLEVFLWGLLERHADPLRIWDVRLGVHPAKVDVKTDCDFDVAFLHQYRLCVIECKSGAQEQDPKADVLYKVEAVVRQFRALGIRSFLATTADNVRGPDGNLRPGIRDRATIYQCRILMRDQIRQFAQLPEDLDLIRQVLFSALVPG
jgi:hypothetical protein